MNWLCTGGQKGIKGFNSSNHFKNATLYFKHILITKGLMSQSSNFFIRGKISILFKGHHGYIIYSLFNRIRHFWLPAAGGALCSEMAEIVQKVALVGSIDFGSSWLLFWE